MLASILIIATGWNFSATAEMPEVYVTKTDNSEEHKEMSKKLDELRDLIIDLHMQK